MRPKTPVLTDASTMAAQHAATFSRPTAATISRLKVGDLVKVCVPTGQRPERFWCEIEAKTGNVFTGRIDNDLVFTAAHGLAYNDRIYFAAENIYATYSKGSPSHSGAIRPRSGRSR